MGLVGFIGDLHLPDNRLYLLTRLLNRVSLDGLVLAGDFVGFPDDRSLNKLLKFLDRYAPSKVVAVLGNHEHYLSKKMMLKGKSSLDVTQRVADKLHEAGIMVLDVSDRAFTVGNLWLAGCVGWYDYSFSPPGYSVEDFERCNPFGLSLVELELCDLHMVRSLCPPWWRRDCLLVRLPFSHPEYVERCVDRVSSQLKNAGYPRVVVYHHVPRRDLVKYTGTERDFDYAYAGSSRLDNPIKIHHVDMVVYGHLHDRSKHRIVSLDGVVYANSYPWYSSSLGFLVVESNHGKLKAQIVWDKTVNSF